MAIARLAAVGSLPKPSIIVEWNGGMGSLEADFIVFPKPDLHVLTETRRNLASQL